MKRPETGLADLVRCAVKLQPDDRTARSIARLLGLDVAPLEPTPPPPTPTPAPRAESVPSPPETTPAPAEPIMEADPEQLDLLSPSGTETRGVSPPWRTVPPLPDSPATPRPAPAPAPLLTPGRSREVLVAAVATVTEDGAVAVDRAVTEVAAYRPLVTLPRRRRRTLRYGVQTLVDIGEAMDPFAEDRRAIVDELDRIVGRPRIRVLRFRDVPDEAGPGPLGTWRTYEPPAPGVPVLVVGDLGIGGAPGRRRSADAWLALEGRLRRRGSDLVALVPYPRDRWPPRFRRRLGIVRWDRSTDVREVQRVRGRGAR